jgi:precorrin-2 dehydrogenase/sirohydrochlorin ferrochelatase
MVPVFLNLAGRLGVVIGGGQVGRRKARALLDGGASVRLVCLEPVPDQMRCSVLEWINAPYEASHLDGAVLVIAAATPEVNRRVVDDARQRGLWVNAATEPESGDFFLPAVARRGALTIAIGTEGTAPGLAAAVRLLLEEQLDAAFATWAELVGELRTLLRQTIPDARLRGEVLRHLCQPQWLQRLRDEEPGKVREDMLREARRLANRL